MWRLGLRKRATRSPQPEAGEPKTLSRWPSIAEFMGQPLSTLHRWAREGMPVERRGRRIVASRDRLSEWLAKETGAAAPVHIAQDEDRDLTPDLAGKKARRHRAARKAARKS
jgi:phage terminase Nu1 subunit (DNA packaging protein)